MTCAKEFARKGTEVQKQYEAKTKAVREALEEERKKDAGDRTAKKCPYRAVDG